MVHLINASSPRTATGGKYSQLGWGYELIRRPARLSRVRLAWIAKNIVSESRSERKNKRGG